MTAPARRLIKPTTPRTVHLLNLSGALTSPVQAEATTEADFVRLAALCPNVVHIVSQPETFELPDRRYTPDYRIECRGGRVTFKTCIGFREADLLTLPEFLEQQDELLLASWLGVSPWRANV